MFIFTPAYLTNSNRTVSPPFLHSLINYHQKYYTISHLITSHSPYNYIKNNNIPYFIIFLVFLPYFIIFFSVPPITPFCVISNPSFPNQTIPENPLTSTHTLSNPCISLHSSFPSIPVIHFSIYLTSPGPLVFPTLLLCSALRSNIYTAAVNYAKAVGD